MRWEHEGVRDAVLAREGYRTMRIGNAAFRDNIEGVMRAVRTALGADVSQPW